MPSPAIRMSRPRPMNVLQELVSTAVAATAIKRIDFISDFDSPFHGACKWILLRSLNYRVRRFAGPGGATSACVQTYSTVGFTLTGGIVRRSSSNTASHSSINSCSFLTTRSGSSPWTANEQIRAASDVCLILFRPSHPAVVNVRFSLHSCRSFLIWSARRHCNLSKRSAEICPSSPRIADRGRVAINPSRIREGTFKPLVSKSPSLRSTISSKPWHS